MTNQSDGWLTIREAADRLGVSDLTVRRRIKSGSLAYRLNAGKYYVNLAVPGPGTVPTTESEQLVPNGEPREVTDLDAAAPEQTAQHAGLDLDALFHQHRRLAEEAGRAALLREQLEKLEQQNAALRDGIVTLSSRNGWLESKLEERERAIRLLTDSQHRRPWWKRLLGTEASA